MKPPKPTTEVVDYLMARVIELQARLDDLLAEAEKRPSQLEADRLRKGLAEHGSCGERVLNLEADLRISREREKRLAAEADYARFAQREAEQEAKKLRELLAKLERKGPESDGAA